MNGDPRTPALSDQEETPWVETRVGGWVFVSSILVAPPLMVAVPLALRAILRTLGVLTGPSPFYDTIPLVAAYAVPYIGWLAVVPMAIILKTLRMSPGPRARVALWFFMAVHLVVLAYTIWSWTFSQTVPEVPMP